MNLEQTPQRIRWVVLAILIGSAVLLTILDSAGLLDTVVGMVRDPMSAASAITTARTDTALDLLSGPARLADRLAPRLNACKPRMRRWLARTNS